MSKRKSKQNQPNSSIQSQESSSKNFIYIQKSKFICQCGKGYKSNSALYTHIKTKHPQAQKKEMKLNSLIINDPKRKSLESSNNIQIKSIYANARLSEFTSIAMVALQDIAIYIRNYDDRKNTQTNFENDWDERIEEDLQQQQDENFEEQVEDNFRENEINKKVQQFKNRYHLNGIDNIADAEELKSIQLNKTKISMIEQLSKYFNIQFGFKIDLSLKLIISQRLGVSSNIKSRYQSAIKQLWGDLQNIIQILQHYASEWKKLMDRPQS